jgi:cell division protein FtsI/penicillin-binding protein 2
VINLIHFEIKKKIKRVEIICFVLFISIILKLGYSQIINYNNLTNKAIELWERSFPIEASRGIIKDRNGTSLAINLPVTSVAVIPYQIKNKEEEQKWLAKYPDFDKAILKGLKEFGRTDLPVVTNMDYGHTLPQLILPYGVMAEINPEKKTVSLLESGVI